MTCSFVKICISSKEKNGKLFVIGIMIESTVKFAKVAQT